MLPPRLLRCPASGFSVAAFHYLGAFYMIFKTHELMQDCGVPGATEWLLQSRLNHMSLKHAPVHSLLWGVLGPSQMLKKARQFVAKIESGGYTDFDPPEQWKAKWRAEAERREVAKADKVKWPWCKCWQQPAASEPGNDTEENVKNVLL